MQNMISRFSTLSAMILLCLLAGIFLSCEKTTFPLAPYAGGPAMSGVNVQDSTYLPKFAWTGGEVSVIGVNMGGKAALDSTLIWLVHSPSDNMGGEPLKYGSLPAGAEDLTAQFGGHHLDSLREDSNYTFWVMKADAWQQVQSQRNMPIVVDTAAPMSGVKGTNSPVLTQGDTVFVSHWSSSVQKKRIDLYINISNIKGYGILCLDPNTYKSYLTITPTNTDNNPIVTFKIVQAGVKDTAVAAFGMTEGDGYDINNIVWEVLTIDSTKIGTLLYYRSLDIIPSPIKCGQTYDRTQVFTQYPPNGLQRNKIYTFWIATKDWDGISHLRSSKYHSYITFQTW